MPIFRIAGQHRRIFLEGFSGIFLWLHINLACFRIASESPFHIASDLGVCDSNRITHRGCIARFRPLRPGAIHLPLLCGSSASTERVCKSCVCWLGDHVHAEKTSFQLILSLPALQLHPGLPLRVQHQHCKRDIFQTRRLGAPFVLMPLWVYLGVPKPDTDVSHNADFSIRLLLKREHVQDLPFLCSITFHIPVGNGQNTVSERELTEFCDKLGEFCKKLGEFASAHK